MIDRQGRRILIECDSCDEVFEGDEGFMDTHKGVEADSIITRIEFERVPDSSIATPGKSK